MLPQAGASIDAAPSHTSTSAQTVIELAERTVRYEQASIDGKVGAGELEAHVRRARKES